MQKFIKNLIKIAGVAAIVYFGAPFLAVLAGGFIALKGVDMVFGISKRMNEREAVISPEVTPEQRKRNEQVHRVNSEKRFFDFKLGQWNIHSFPLDMYPTVGMFNSENAMFSCCGIENIVHARVTRDLLGRQRAEFRMQIRDEKKAQDVAETIARSGIIGTRVMRSDENTFELISDNAVDINTLVKQFYPPRSFEVAREMLTTRQFVVSGCSCYEDALKEFKKNRDRYQNPVATMVTYQNIIDGHREPKISSGDGYNVDMLPAGVYVINETTMDYYSKNVSVNGGVDMTDEAMRSDAALAAHFTLEDKVEDRSSMEPKYSNALEGRTPARTITLDGESVEVMFEGNAKMSQTGAAMYIAFSSRDELLEVISGEKPLTGRMVLVDTQRPDIGKDEFLLELPADSDLFTSLQLRGSQADVISERVEDLSVSRKDIERTLICHELNRSKYVSAELVREPDLSKAFVAGVPADQFLYRMQDMVECGKAEAIKSVQRTNEWLADAALIKQASLEVDLRRRELVLTSTVQKDGVIYEKREACKLSQDQLEKVSRMGDVPEAELRDLVMRLHPDFFTVYCNSDGTSRYANPIQDFIEGRMPRLTKAVEKEKRQEKKAKMAAEKEPEPKRQAKNNARKKGSTQKMS